MSLWRPFTRATAPESVDAELAQHLELLTRKYIAEGMSEADARAKAAERFGALTPVRDECHVIAEHMDSDMRRTEYIQEFTLDASYALRMLRRSPVFTAIAILTLAIGIGANTAIFSVVRSVILRPLPYPHPEQLVQLWTDHRALGRAQPEWFSPPEFFDWKAQNKTFSGMSAYNGWLPVITDNGEPEALNGFQLTGDFFTMLGVNAAHGRLFTMDDDAEGVEQRVVITDALWRRRFGGDTAVLGKRLTINGGQYTVIGVLPSDFRPPLPAPADIYRTFSRPANNRCGRACFTWRAIGRMKPGVNIAQARADLGGLATHLGEQYPETNAKVGAWIVPLHEQISGPSQAALFAMAGAVALVLLIACVNIANLLLVRGASRARELSVRAALGAGSARIVRQLITENAVLATVGGALGLALGVYGSRALAVLVPDSIRQVQEIRVDGMVLAFAAAATMLAGAMFGFLPAFRAARSNSHQWLRGGTREIGARSGALRGGLVVAQLSLAVVLLVGAGLLLRSFLLMERVDLGYRTDGVLMMNVAFPVLRYPDAARVTSTMNALLDRTRANPAIKSAEITDLTPLSGGGDQDISAFPVGESKEGLPPSMWYRRVTPGYLPKMQMRLKSGRMFTAEDRAGAPRVAIINEEAARAFWHGKDSVGRQFLPTDAPDAPDVAKITVIGVIANARHDGPNQPYKPEAFTPIDQSPTRGVVLVVEPARDAASAVAAVREALKAIDPLVPMPAARDLESMIGDAVRLPKLYATLVGIFATAALLLAVLGVYGVMAYSVSQRQREIGVRLALGAAPSSILGMILGEGGRLAAIGVGLGLGAALALGRALQALLFGVTAFDVPTFVAVAAVLGVMTMIAAWVPARRAMRVDPLAAIREE